MNKIFNKNFLALSPEQIALEINNHGYFKLESALTHEFLEQVELDSTANKFSLNINEPGGVFLNQQYYFCNLLLSSFEFYKFCTSKLILDICTSYLGDKFRLKALRYYETYGGHHMEWHTDNKTDRGIANIPGLIFIFYVSNVTDGEFQYIEGSHHWSGESAYSVYSDTEVNQRFKDKICSFKMPKGSIVIYNTFGIHRANPVSAKNFMRKSVFFQVDADFNNSEPLFINSSFISHLNKRVEMFLGFGLSSTNRPFPKTNLNALPLSSNVFRLLFKWIAYRTYRLFLKR